MDDTGGAGEAEPGEPRERVGPSGSLATVGRNVLRAVLVVGSVVTLGFVNTPTEVYVPLIALTAMVIPVTFLLEPSGSSFRVWTLYLVGFVLFAHLRNFADETAIPTRFQYAIDLEALLFGGAVPTVWLQERLYTGGRGLFEMAMVGVHLSYFLVPHGLALMLWLLAPRHLPRYTAAALLTFALGLVGYFLLPTAPPWYATEQGYLDGTVRVITDLGQWIHYGAYSRVYNLVGGPNPVAAMPSLHTALTVLVALMLGRWVPRLSWLGWAYAGAMAFALVFLAEHYVVDALAGLAVALIAWWGSARWDAGRGGAAEGRSEEELDVQPEAVVREAP